jgi:hypothetical protein
VLSARWQINLPHVNVLAKREVLDAPIQIRRSLTDFGVARSSR